MHKVDDCTKADLLIIAKFHDVSIPVATCKPDLKVNVEKTSSGAGSPLVDHQVLGVNFFLVYVMSHTPKHKGGQQPAHTSNSPPPYCCL